jgi:hypothetical protein
MVFSIEIINKDGKKFILQEAECKNCDYTMNSKLFKQPLPDTKAEDAIIINLGQEKTVAIPMQLRVTETDASEGTNNGPKGLNPNVPVLTVQNKVDYLESTFFTSGTEDLYTVNIYTACANILNKKGILEGYGFNPTAEKPNVLPGSITISIGGGKQV